jgi:hypothetical protein
MLQAGSGPMNRCSNPNLASLSAISLQQYNHDLAPISVELCYVWPVVWGIDGSPRPVLGWSGMYLPSTLITAWQSDRI